MMNLKIDNYIITTSIVDILERLRVELTNGKLKDIEAKDDDIAVTCPVHNNGLEHDPDCHINLGKNPKLPYGYYHCFACGSSGTFDKFVAECFGSTVEYAKHWLLENFDAKIAFESINLGEAINLNKIDNKSYMNDTFLNDLEPYCPYLAKRKLTRDTCKKFNVKYDSKYRQVVFPCYDAAGHLIAALRRSIDTKTFYIPKDIEKPLYGLDQVFKNSLDKVLITEGLFDRLVSEQYGMPAIATLGSPSEEQIKILNTSELKIVYLAFDNDAAGEAFNQFFHNKLAKRILIKDIHIPKPYKDIGDLDYETFWRLLQKN